MPPYRRYSSPGVFDSLNDLDSMELSVRRVLRTGKLAEVAVCYTGDVDNPARTKYGLEYYAELARRIEGMGAHILCIKDMAGLLRPQAARMLVRRLREVTQLPLHLHTHDTSGNGVATYLAAIESGVHIVDTALAPMAGLTSQPSMNALIAALRGAPRETGLTNKVMQPLCDYWDAVREHYAPFECGLKSSTSEVYYHEIPGGQYSNLRPQVASLGLLHRWADVRHAFAVVNQLCGDIPKVTPSSKMVGDFAIFLVQNDLLTMRADLAASTEATKQKLLLEARRLDFPQSVVQYFQGCLGQPPGGYPEDLRAAVLKGLPTLQGRPSDGMAPFDFAKARAHVAARTGRDADPRDVVSHALYPRVLDDFFAFQSRCGDVSLLPTPVYFYGLDMGQEVWIELEPGKSLLVSLEARSEPDEEGNVTVYFLLNGQSRQVVVPDRSLRKEGEQRRRADAARPGEVGAPMPGRVIALHAKEGQAVQAGEPLLTLEAMKMETIVRAPCAGVVRELCVDVKAQVKGQDLLVVGAAGGAAARRRAGRRAGSEGHADHEARLATERQAAGFGGVELQPLAEDLEAVERRVVRHGERIDANASRVGGHRRQGDAVVPADAVGPAADRRQVERPRRGVAQAEADEGHRRRDGVVDAEVERSAAGAVADVVGAQTAATCAVLVRRRAVEPDPHPHCVRPEQDAGGRRQARREPLLLEHALAREGLERARGGLDVAPADVLDHEVRGAVVGERRLQPDVEPLVGRHLERIVRRVQYHVDKPRKYVHSTHWRHLRDPAHMI